MEDTVLTAGTTASPRRMLKSESTIALDTAVLAAKLNYKPLLKTHKNPFFDSKYADLLDVFEAVEPALSAQGVLIFQAQDLANGKLTIHTEVVHVATGEFRASYMETPVLADPQKMGSVSTYLRRYAIATLAGVAADSDDDGNAGASPSKSSDKPKVSQTPAKPTDAPRPGSRTPVAASEPPQGPPAPSDPPPTPADAPGKGRARTAEDKAGHSAIITALQKSANEEKVKEYIIVNVGPDYKKAPFEKWDAVLKTMQAAQQAGTLAELVGV